MKIVEGKTSWVDEIQGVILDLKKNHEKQRSLTKQVRILLTRQLAQDGVLEFADYCHSESKKPPVWFLMGGLSHFVLGYNFIQKEIQLIDTEKDYYFDEFYEIGKVGVHNFWKSRSLNQAVVQILNKEHSRLKNQSLVKSAEEFGGFGGIKFFKEDVLSKSLEDFVRRSLLVRVPALWAKDCKDQLKLQGRPGQSKILCTKTMTDSSLKDFIFEGLNSSYNPWLECYGTNTDRSKFFYSGKEKDRFDAILSESCDDLGSLPIQESVTEKDCPYTKILNAYENNLLTEAQATKILKNRIQNFGFRELDYCLFADSWLIWFAFKSYTETLPQLLAPIASDIRPLLDQWHAETGKELPDYLEQVFTVGPEKQKLSF